jgi:hypothetical protein
VGRVVRLNKHPFTILGVAPPEFHGTLLFISPDFFVPIVNKEQLDGDDILNARGNRGILMALGHLLAACTNLGSLFAARAWIEPQPHFAAGIYRSRADFTCRRRCRTRA